MTSTDCDGWEEYSHRSGWGRDFNPPPDTKLRRGYPRFQHLRAVVVPSAYVEAWWVWCLFRIGPRVRPEYEQIGRWRSEEDVKTAMSRAVIEAEDYLGRAFRTDSDPIDAPP